MRARIHLALAQVERLALAANGLEDGLAARAEVFSAWSTDASLTVPPTLTSPAVTGSWPVSIFTSVDFPRRWRRRCPDDRGPRHLEAQIIDKDPIADLLPQALGDDDLLAETRPRRDPDRARADAASSAVRAASTSAS